jgi:hypothetical protein
LFEFIGNPLAILGTEDSHLLEQRETYTGDSFWIIKIGSGKLKKENKVKKLFLGKRN